MKLIITMLASCLLLSIYAMAQPHGKGIGFGPNNNPARVTPKPTPLRILVAAVVQLGSAEDVASAFKAAIEQVR